MKRKSPHCLVAVALLIFTSLTVAGEQSDHTRFSKGIFWSVAKDGKVVGHILGTFHSNDSRVLALPDNVRKVLSASNSLSMESFPGVRYFNPHWGFRNIIRDMTLPENKTLESLIGQDWYQRIVRLLAKHGVKEDRIKHLYPWAVMNELGMRRFTTGEKRGKIMDHMIYEMVADKVEDLYQVETLEELVAAYYDFPMDVQIDLLKDRVDAHARLPEVSERLLLAYLDEDVERMLQLSVQFISEDSLGKGHDKVYLKNVLYERNHVMAHHMLAPLRRGSAFIAVGALHLYGEEGVLRLLENYGFSLRRVELKG